MKKFKIFLICCFMLIISSICLVACDNTTNDPNRQYSITVQQSSNGFVAVDKSLALAGETVNITTLPDSGYAVKLIAYNSIIIEENTFIMPAQNVTVTARFAKLYDIEIDENFKDILTTNVTQSISGKTINIDIDEKYSIDKIFINGKEIQGTSFVMPEEKVVITAEYSQLKVGSYVCYARTNYDGEKEILSEETYDKLDFIEIVDSDTANFGFYIYENDIKTYLFMENISYEIDEENKIKVDLSVLPIAFEVKIINQDEITVDVGGEIILHLMYKQDIVLSGNYQSSNEEDNTSVSIGNNGKFTINIDGEIMDFNYKICGNVFIYYSDDLTSVYVGELTAVDNGFYVDMKINVEDGTFYEMGSENDYTFTKVS